MEDSVLGVGRRAVAGVRNVLPEGRPLPEGPWRRRHKTILVLVWSHAIGLPIFGIIRGAGVWHSLLEGTVVAAFGVAALLPFSRRTRAVMATLGILSSSAILVHLSGGTIEAHFHFFVMVGVISLYQDWTPFLLAVGYVVVHHGTVGVMSPESVYNHPAALADPWMWAGIHGLFILGACAVSLVAWRLNEDARAKAQEYYRRMYEGEHALVEELKQAQAVKDELIAMVSHELRTPLTAIIGFGRTLTDFWDRLTVEERKESLDGSLRQAERLRRHVENLLEAARVSERNPQASSDLHQTVATVLEELRDVPGHEQVTIDADVEPVSVAISADALHLVVVNLVGNAMKYALPETVVAVRAGAAGPSQAFLSVTNMAPPLDESDMERIFEPFVKLDAAKSGMTSGLGLGLHIARRVVDLHEGSIDVTHRDGCVTFRVALPQASGETPSPARAGLSETTAAQA